MELPGQFLEQIAYKSRPKIDEHMLVVMDKSTLEDYSFQSLQIMDK